jgi:hypothetical protein
MRRRSPFRARDVWNTHIDLFNRAAESNHIFVRCEGHVCAFGMASKNARRGDVVALVSGVSLPMILREHETGYEVVGPAFVANAMDGRLWKSLDKVCLKLLCFCRLCIILLHCI